MVPAVSQALGSRDSPALATTILCWSVTPQVSEQRRPGVRMCECVCVCDAPACTGARLRGRPQPGGFGLRPQRPLQGCHPFSTSLPPKSSGRGNGTGARSRRPGWPPDSLLGGLATRRHTARPPASAKQRPSSRSAPDSRPLLGALKEASVPPAFRWRDLPPRKTCP